MVGGVGSGTRLPVSGRVTAAVYRLGGSFGILGHHPPFVGEIHGGSSPRGAASRPFGAGALRRPFGRRFLPLKDPTLPPPLREVLWREGSWAAVFRRFWPAAASEVHFREPRRPQA